MKTEAAMIICGVMGIGAVAWYLIDQEEKRQAFLKRMEQDSIDSNAFIEKAKAFNEEARVFLADYEDEVQEMQDILNKVKIMKEVEDIINKNFDKP